MSPTVSDGSTDDPLPVELTAPPTVKHGRFRRIYYGETRIDFVRRRRIWFTISAIVILVGAISLGVRGLNFGIDFVGGTSWTVPSKTVDRRPGERCSGFAHLQPRDDDPRCLRLVLSHH